ncbi:uncharacterized protein [Rutidosis leptorrhynchoides]|uniref:uncharacterized protein n=1 Tax=Rutidosis leptorrhynchoides TaxID=125765 RepID=UPI003A9A0B5E
MKILLKELPTLTAPAQGETLTLNLAASSEAISSVLIADGDKVQMPVYFVSKILQNGKVNYSSMEKLIMHSYTHKHEISFLPRNSIKGQVIADFLVELPSEIIKRDETPVTKREEDEIWELYTDGASSEEGAGIGLLLVSPDGEEITYTICMKFAASNNEAEYEALLAGLHLEKIIEVKRLTAYVDSQLVASQLNHSFEAQDTLMQKYPELAKTLAKDFATFERSKYR